MPLCGLVVDPPSLSVEGALERIGSGFLVLKMLAEDSNLNVVKIEVGAG